MLLILGFFFIKSWPNYTNLLNFYSTKNHITQFVLHRKIFSSEVVKLVVCYNIFCSNFIECHSKFTLIMLCIF